MTRTGVILATLAGLCACAGTNTTLPGARPVMQPASQMAMPSAAAPGQLAGGSDAPGAPVVGQAPPPVVVATGPVESSAPVSPAAPQDPSRGPLRVALLLPLASDSLRRAAEVVQAGFMASYEREAPGAMVVEVIETGDTPQDVLAGYNAAVADYDAVVGPLSRSGVTAIAQHGRIAKPTIALAQADGMGEADMALPPNMLSIGLSVEDEARQAARLADADSVGPRAMVISSPVAWQRRAARAFSSQWQRRGAERGSAVAVEAVELGLVNGYLNANSIATLLKRLQVERPSMIFAALDAAQARQLRESIGVEIPFYGTSQLNPLALPDWTTSDPLPLMDGVILVDMPWQLQVDHPAVMVYPRMTVAADQRRSPDLERLYALGIDAQRVARELALRRTIFEIDGVTGRLRVDMTTRPARFERVESPAVYQNGKVVPALDR